MEQKIPSMRRPRDSKEAEGKKESIEVVIARNFPSTNVQHVSPGRNENPNAPPERDGSKIEVLELIFLLANFIVELMSIVFDQLSSQHKAPFLLLCLIMSISAVLISTSELVCKHIKEMAIWKRVRSWQCWLYNPPSGVRVGFFPYIIALTCAFGQFIITTVNYSLYRKHGNAPIKASIWSTVFAFGQLLSSLSSRVAKTETKTTPESELAFPPMPELAPQPKPKPTPTPEPESEPESESKPMPLPELAFASRSESKSEPEPVPELEFASGSRSESESKSESESEAESESESAPWLKPHLRKHKRY